MEKNIIILAVVLSMLGLVGLGGLYSLCWREALREDIVYARDTRRRRPSLESQLHRQPEVRDTNPRRGRTRARQSQTHVSDAESSQDTEEDKQEGEWARDNGPGDSRRDEPKGNSGGWVATDGLASTSNSGGWAPSDGLASRETAATLEWNGEGGKTRRETSKETAANSEWERDEPTERRRETSPERPTSPENAGRRPKGKDSSKFREANEPKAPLSGW